MTSADLLAGVGVLMLFLMFFFGLTSWLTQPRIPNCPEDAYIVGRGQYEHGFYEVYECGPAMDDVDIEVAP